MSKPKSLLIVILGFFLLGMASAPAKPSLVKGIITDSKTSQPIAGAKVKLVSILGQTKASALTDSNGNYALKNLSFTTTGSRYILTASKADYDSKSVTQYFRSGNTYTVNIALNHHPKANYPPVINSIAPADNSVFLAGAEINLQINASDVENDPLEYQFSLGGTVKQSWSASNTCAWQTSSSDTSSINILYEVRDAKGAKASRVISCRIINPTVQEILQKVADNYAKLYDFQADMTMSSTLNGQPFGETEYCRYYFKAPDKEKTETYSDSSRAVKTDVIMIDGTTMHLFDPVNNIKQDVDLLSDAGIDANQFNQMDMYYNQNLFLNRHTIIRNNVNSDLGNMIVFLDATPKTQNNIYDKLGICIDYSKGIITKYSIYKKNESGQLELVQETKTIESKMLSNNVWLPVKMTKTPNLTSGNLISTMTYDNLQLNTGLRDVNFDPNKQ